MDAILIIIVFILGYLAIAFEHNIGINKAASALITGVVCWTIYILQHSNHDVVENALLEHIGDIASIVFFLLGAMTIVEIIDSHSGFEIITSRIKTTSKSRLLFIIVIITFFLSALLDNLTTSIVMASVIKKIVREKEDRLWYAGAIIIAANAGGAWSPLGDVTTTMLWIGGQITALNIIKQLIAPSLAVAVLPTLLISFKLKGTLIRQPAKMLNVQEAREGNIILVSGISFLLFVPLFKTITHLPPFMGMLLVLGFMWLLTTIIHKNKENNEAQKFTVANALQKVDSPSILFFLGILLAVAALQEIGVLKQLATFLTNKLQHEYKIGTVLGLLSALVDNVPLVAACQGMFDLTTYPTDHRFWEFLALTTGTGGSAIIIGSAAGVAIMGIEEISFIWYLKRISLLAIIGFICGILVFMIQSYLLFT